MGDTEVPYRRVLLKLSGEALMGELDYGIEPGPSSALRPKSRPRRNTVWKSPS